MKKSALLLVAAIGLTVCFGGVRTELFNGKDLSGWTAVVDYDVTGGYSAAEPTWFAADGVIRTTGTPFGYLRTKRTDYRNLKLHVEYRWWRKTAKPNSGVFVCLASENGGFLPTAIENQLCEGKAGDVLGLAGRPLPGLSPRDAYTPAKPLSGITAAARKGEANEKPFGEWNVLEVEVRDGRLVNCVNGRELNRLEGLDATTGAIALQSEGGAAEFRNVWIEE